MNISERLISVEQSLRAAGIPHAFGGAIALIYYAEPRATADLDINIFLPPEQGSRVLDTLATVFPIPNRDEILQRLSRDAQARLQWEEMPVDLFFSNLTFHQSMAQRVREVDYVGGTKIAILSAEDLIICKAAFDRAKDWIDIRNVLLMQGSNIEHSYIRHWFSEFFTPASPQLERWSRTLTSLSDSFQ